MQNSTAEILSVLFLWIEAVAIVVDALIGYAVGRHKFTSGHVLVFSGEDTDERLVGRFVDRKFWTAVSASFAAIPVALLSIALFNSFCKALGTESPLIFSAWYVVLMIMGGAVVTAVVTALTVDGFWRQAIRTDDEFKLAERIHVVERIANFPPMTNLRMHTIKDYMDFLAGVQYDYDWLGKRIENERSRERDLHFLEEDMKVISTQKAQFERRIEQYKELLRALRPDEYWYNRENTPLSTKASPR